MKEYATTQRKLLFDFLKQHHDQHYSIEEIANSLCSAENISMSSIYRNINYMVANGSVRRFSADGSRRFLYQYIGSNDTDCSKHIHLKCEQCGKIFHLGKEAMDAVVASTKQNNSFNIDIKRTILYGSCKDCD
ncbi:transcriptional repressor [Clostridia bacterium OttesenSCG-928-F22]|nr:transcriptional repressor [Clostridia bacterium OttesenSCG-928-F22]